MKTFNIIIVGVGGQGLVTLSNIIAQAAFFQGFEVRTSELHGLSQREGSVQTYIRFGKKVYSPLISKTGADLVIGLEITEGLRSVCYGNPKTFFVINSQYIMYEGALLEEKIRSKINSLAGKNFYLLGASEICKKELNNEVVSSVYLLGFCLKKGIIPLKPESVEKAIEKIIPPKYLELNKKAFELAKND